MKDNMRHKRGLGIIAAIIIMLVMAVMGVTLASLLGTNAQSSVNYMQSQQAFYLAESGIQSALFALKSNSTQANWTTAGWTGTYPAGPMQLAATLSGHGDYNVTIDLSVPKSPHITSTGYIPNRNTSNAAKRVVDVYAQNTNLLGQYAGFAGGSGGGSTIAVSMNGQSYTDSYNASIGRYNVNGNIGQQGDVGTNADIATSGQADINGNATTGPSGTFSNQAAVSGTIAHNSNVTLPAVVVPASLTSLPSSGSISVTGQGTQALASGNYKYSSISTSGQATLTITGPANIYLTGSSSISSSGQSQIAISASSAGPVIIYADGNISASGQGFLNNTYLPANLQIYGSNASSQNITLSGQAAFYGLIYAPEGNLSISGQGGAFGSFIGDQLTMSGQAAIHHDVSLASLTMPSWMPGGWKQNNWKEVY